MSGEGFYRRWSKRKAETRQEPKAARTFAALEDPPALDLPPAPESEESPREVTPTPDRDAPNPDRTDPEADLPDIEQMDYDSDYRGFLSEGVSDKLRNKALRRLWRSNPILASVDGLDDYDEDYTDAAMVITGMKTAFDAVRGYAPPPEEEDAKEPADGAIAAADSATETEGTDPDASEEPSKLSGKDEITEKIDQV